MDLITALDEAIENVIQCAWAVEENSGTAVASERFERITKACTVEAVRRLKRKREECEHMQERRECACEKEKEGDDIIETLEPDPPAETD